MKERISYETYSKLLDEGLTDEDIKRFEDERLKPNPIARFFLGGDPTKEELTGDASLRPVPNKHNLSKNLQVAGSILGYTGSTTAKKGIAPLVAPFQSPEAQKRIQEKIKSKATLGGSDILEEEIIPYLKSRPEGFITGVPRFAARIATDVATDPLTLLGIGGVTKAGRLIASLREARVADIAISPTSKLARDITKLMGKKFNPKSSSKVISQFEKKFSETTPKTFSQQISAGERNLLSVGPLGVTGKIPAKLIAPLSMARRGAVGSKIEELVRDVFSTKSGDPDFDLLVSKMKSQVEYRKGMVIEDAKVMNKELKDITRQTGMTREEVIGHINKIGEAVVPKAKEVQTGLQPAIKIGKDIHINKDIRDTHSDIVQRLDEDKLLGEAQDSGKYTEDSFGYVDDKGKFYTLDEAGKKFKVFDSTEIKEGKVTTSINTAKKIYSKQSFDIMDHHFTDLVVTARVALTNATTKYNRLIAGGQGQAAERFHAIIEKESRNLTEAQAGLNQLHGYYTPPPSVNPMVDKFVNENQERLSRQILREQTSGHQIENIVADRKYLPHIMTPETMESFINHVQRTGPKGMSSKQFDSYLANALHRNFTEINYNILDAWKQAKVLHPKQIARLKAKDGTEYAWKLLEQGKITEPQYNDLVHALSIEEVHALPHKLLQSVFGADFKAGQKVFIEDPIYQTTIRGLRGEVARTGTEFYQQMIDRGFAKPEGTPGTEKWVKTAGEELKGHVVPPEYARVLNRIDLFKHNPQSIQDVWHLYDRVHSLMKIWTLAPFPSYHTLNAVGNFWNNWLAGVDNPDRYRQASWVQAHNVEGKFRPVNFKDIFGSKWDSERIWKEANELGVVGRGQYGIEGTQGVQSIQRELEGGKILTLSSRQHLLRVGRRVGKYIEDNARLAHFIDRLKKGDTAEQAAESVKKFLFDYSDLTAIEKNVLNRAFFFYTWTRKNIPLQLQSLVQTPYKFAMPYKIKNQIEHNVPVGADDEKHLADYFKDNFPIRIKYNPKTKEYTYFLLNRWIPAADILKLSQLHQVAADMITPLFKEMTQQAFNTDWHIHKKIERIKGEKSVMFGHNVPARVAHAARSIRLLSEIDRMTKPDQDMWDKAVSLLGGRNVVRYDPIQGVMSDAGSLQSDEQELQNAIIRERMKKIPRAEQDREVDRIKGMIKQRALEFNK